ncbi:MAG TPA: aminotransferase class V-fold PLP-dependent enzyme [Solirubrobacteraceae bacterium]|nr:aminotransferase class V-fold PLP-dependent enzyme [Solirubrobacteraceae bacterium]
MRALGHRVVDALVDVLTDPATPALRRATPAEMERRLHAEPPSGPRDLAALLDDLREHVFPFMSRLDHPGYFAFIPACGTFPGALGDFLASALNPYVGTWMEAAGPSRLELVVLEWFKRWIGFPPEAAGVLVSGGSAANMTALACAREALLGPMTDTAVAYVSDQAHSSLARAARVLGFGPEQVRVIPSDADFRLPPGTLAAAMDADLAAGRRPLLVAAAAGTTNTGAVDPLTELATLCRRRGVWLHVDGSYGAFAALTDRGREALRGIELADSVTLDPHKWLYQPFECGSLLVRDGHALRRAFEIAPDYLRDATVEGSEVNFADRGLQLSRGARALKVWLSVSFFGVEAFRAAIDRCLDLAVLAERHVRASPELELLSPASLGIVAFRRRGVGGEGEDEVARRNAALVSAFERTGRGLVSSTRLRGRYAIRLCVMNHTSGEEHVRGALDWFARADARGAGPAPAARPSPRRAALGDDGWLVSPVFAPGELARLPLFASLTARERARVAAWAREARVATGEAVTRRWEAARDFYVVVEGRAAAERDGRAVAEFRPGDFFGELAALDWGAGYGYGRQATVTAVEPLRLLVLAPAHLARLMAAAPSVEAAVRRAAQERLDRVAAES